MTATRLQTRHGLEIEERFGYSQGMIAGEFIYVSGQVPRDESGNPIVEPDLTAKFEKTASNISVVLERLGASLAALVYVQLHVMPDLVECWDELAALARRFFAAAGPAGTIIQVAGLNHPSYLIEISAIATAPAQPGVERKSAMSSKRDNIAPANQTERECGLSSAVKVGKQVFVSGQMSLDKDGKLLHPGDVGAQFDQALKNFAAVLEKAGASSDQVVATHMFLTATPDERQFVAICDAHRATFSSANHPTGTMVYVPKLPVPGAMVCITGTAVLD
jgi:2-iminobutanoate/2-iminopropanoate deaminase